MLAYSNYQSKSSETGLQSLQNGGGSSLLSFLAGFWEQCHYEDSAPMPLFHLSLELPKAFFAIPDTINFSPSTQR